MTTAIIVAAGSSRRMGFNKLLAELGGQPVLRRTLAAFERCAAVDEVLVVGGEGIAEAVAVWVAVVSGGCAAEVDASIAD
jgi:2-C-methyl-D-erythritol 4-phosphate cytidylyltransferase